MSENNRPASEPTNPTNKGSDAGKDDKAKRWSDYVKRRIEHQAKREKGAGGVKPLPVWRALPENSPEGNPDQGKQDREEK